MPQIHTLKFKNLELHRFHTSVVINLTTKSVNLRHFLSHNLLLSSKVSFYLIVFQFQQ